MTKKIKYEPARPLKLTASDLRTFKKLARKLADAALNQPYKPCNSQFVACLDFLMQELEEGRL